MKSSKILVGVIVAVSAGKVGASAFTDALCAFDQTARECLSQVYPIRSGEPTRINASINALEVVSTGQRELKVHLTDGVSVEDKFSAETT